MTGKVSVKQDKLRTPFKNAIAKPKGCKDNDSKKMPKGGMKK